MPWAFIASGVHHEGTNGTWRHGVVMLFVCLDVLTILIAAMLVVINGLSIDDGAGAEGVGYTILVWKRIQPVYSMVGHLDDHSWRNVGKQDGIVDHVHPLLKSADEAFNLSNVFIMCSLIQANSQISKIATHGLKLTVHFGNCKTKN